MCIVKQLGQLNAQTGEFVDVEGTPVGDVVGGNAEMSGAPVLILDQRIQFAPGSEPRWLPLMPPD